MTKITIAKGDGIGPEIMNAVLMILKEAKAPLEFEEIEIGEKVYLSGNTSGISENSWNSIRKNKILLKAPVSTPQGGGFKSINVSMRKVLGMFANVRPCMSLHPFVPTLHPNIDLVIVRENEEDLYAGIEHQHTDEVVQCLKLISRPGCEKIVRYAFEYAKKNNRKKVSCISKDNIMKQTDGLFHKVFDKIALEYPDIQNDHHIVDIGAAKLADTPEMFDVIVTPNLYGDILSDIAAQLTGSVGLAGSANIGDQSAMFEAIHGSAPDIAGKNIANPSGLLQAAIMMLNHIGENLVAEKIMNAWLKTIEDGIHTADIFKQGKSKKRVGTQEFAEELVARLGEMPSTFKPVHFPESEPIPTIRYERKKPKVKKLLGVDLFIHCYDKSPDELAKILQNLNSPKISLQLITNRGVKVWPNGFPETFCTDHWRCRFLSPDENGVDASVIPQLLLKAIDLNLDTIKTENLYTFDGQIAFALGQGQ